jgi:hypothetical protein
VSSQDSRITRGPHTSSMPKRASSTAAPSPRTVRAEGAASGEGKTVSKASLKRAAAQQQTSSLVLEPHARLEATSSAAGRRRSTKSTKTSSGNDVHSGLTPQLAAMSGGGAPDMFSLGGDSDDDAGTPAARTRAAGKAQQPHQAGAKAFVHVGAGGTGKRYTGVSAEKAAKKAWRDCKQLLEITVRQVDGGAESTFQASAWTGSGGDGLGAKKFGRKSAGSRRDKGASFRKM